MSYVQVHSDTLDRILDKLESLEMRVRTLQSRMGEPLLTVKDAARELGCSTKTIHRRIADGDLVPVDCNGKKLFTIDEINRYKMQ